MSSWHARYLSETIHHKKSWSTLLLYWGLSPLSFLYGLLMRARSRLYRCGLKQAYRAAVPVVAVGNLTAGGTGKTPTVDFLLKHARSRGVQCAVVSRGYGGRYRGPVGVVRAPGGPLAMTPHECGDEPFLLALRNPEVPVYVARRRASGVQAAERGGAALIVLDDAFQHLAVKRDADIVLLDARHPFGNGRLIPAGTLREPIAALRRADLVIVTRSGETLAPALPREVPVLYSRHVPDNALRCLNGDPADPRLWRGKSVLAFAGIARPDDFFNSLGGFGFSRIETLALDDHQDYTPDILSLLNRSCDNLDLLVTTEKDAVKLTDAAFTKPCLQLGMTLSFNETAPLDALLEQLYRSRRAPDQ